MVMKETPRVSVIIPTLNEEKYLPLLLLSLRKVASPLQIIIVDGRSKDRTKIVAFESKKYFNGKSSLQFIEVPKKGIALQRNIGVTYATNEILLFCDADIIAPSITEHRQMIYEFVRDNYVVATSKMVPMEKTISSILLHSFAYGVQKYLPYAESISLVARTCSPLKKCF